MPDPRPQVRQDTNGEGAERLSNLFVVGEAEGGVVVDEVSDNGQKEHGWHLLPLALVDDDETGREGQDEDDFPPKGIAGRACDVGGSGRVDGAVDGGANGDAEAEEKGVNYGVDHADGAGDDVLRLQFEGAAEDGVAREDEGNGGLGEGGEAEGLAVVD